MQGGSSPGHCAVLGCARYASPTFGSPLSSPHLKSTPRHDLTACCAHTHWAARCCTLHAAHCTHCTLHAHPNARARKKKNSTSTHNSSQAIHHKRRSNPTPPPTPPPSLKSQVATRKQAASLTPQGAKDACLVLPAMPLLQMLHARGMRLRKLGPLARLVPSTMY